MEEPCWFAVNFPGDRAANASASHGFSIIHSHSSYRSFPSQFISQGLLSTKVSAHSGSCSGNIAGSVMETSRHCACRKKALGLMIDQFLKAMAIAALFAIVGGVGELRAEESDEQTPAASPAPDLLAAERLEADNASSGNGRTVLVRRQFPR